VLYVKECQVLGGKDIIMKIMNVFYGRRHTSNDALKIKVLTKLFP